MGPSTPPATCSTPVPLATAYRTPSASPASALFEQSITGPSSGEQPPMREQGSTSSGRASRDDAPSGGPPKTADVARVRSAAGSGESGTPWWTPSAAKVPPQLLGGSAGSYAVSRSAVQTREPGRKPSDARNLLHSAAVSAPSATTAPPLPPESCVPLRQHSASDSNPQFKIFEFKDSPPKTPSSEESTRTAHSSATSLGHQVRTTRSDMRLFKKHSKPVQHVKKKSRARSDSSQPLRSPTYGKPKVIQDSRDQDSHEGIEATDTIESLQAFLESSVKRPIGPLKLPQTKPLRNTRSTALDEHQQTSLRHSRSQSPISPHSSPAAPKRPGILRSSSSLDVSILPHTYHIRLQDLPMPKLPTRDSPSSYGFISPRRRNQHSSSGMHTPRSSPTTTSSPMTPGTADTNRTESRQFQPEDHYFSSLHLSMNSRQGFTPTISPTSPDQAALQSLNAKLLPPHSINSEHRSVAVHETVVQTPKTSSILSLFGKHSTSKEWATVSQSQIASEIPSAVTLLRNIAITATGDPSKRPERPHKTSTFKDTSLQTYFARSRRHQASSEMSSPVVSPMTRVEDKECDIGLRRVRCPPMSSEDLLVASSFIPLLPLRENFDRSRRVSIEVPGSPCAFYPLDTPEKSPDTATETPNSLTEPPALPQARERKLISRTSLSRIVPFVSHLPGSKRHTRTQLPEIQPKHKHSTILEEFVAELRGTQSMRKLSMGEEQSPRLLTKRRSAVVILPRQPSATKEPTVGLVKRSTALLKSLPSIAATVDRPR